MNVEANRLSLTSKDDFDIRLKKKSLVCSEAISDCVMLTHSISLIIASHIKLINNFVRCYV